jgi:hypothetical protein
MDLELTARYQKIIIAGAGPESLLDINNQRQVLIGSSHRFLNSRFGN